MVEKSNFGAMIKDARLKKDLSKEELEYTRERLLRYCELDTYAMVKIYEKLESVVKEN